MKSYVTLPLVSLGAMAALSSFNVSAHGWVEFQGASNTCYLDGGFWTNEIPNQACQAAYDESGAYPFVQRSEICQRTKLPRYGACESDCS